MSLAITFVTSSTAVEYMFRGMSDLYLSRLSYVLMVPDLKSAIFSLRDWAMCALETWQFSDVRYWKKRSGEPVWISWEDVRTVLR